MNAALDVEIGPATVGTVVGAAGVLFLLEPVVGPIPVGGLRVRSVALSAVFLAIGFLLGAVVFSRRGRRLFAASHAVFGVAWAATVLGTATGSGILFVGGIVLMVAGCGFLVTQARDL